VLSIAKSNGVNGAHVQRLAAMGTAPGVRLLLFHLQMGAKVALLLKNKQRIAKIFLPAHKTVCCPLAHGDHAPKHAVVAGHR
jgi:hypothetical protein